MRPGTFTALMLALAVVLPGCDTGGADFRADDEVEEAERFGGTAVIASISDIPDLNPLTSTETLASEIQQFVLFLPVVQYDENFEVRPAFARSWEVNADTTLLTFHLRDDVFWHDGVKASAHDLAFAYDMARNPETGFPNTAFWTYYRDGEVVDSFTFQVGLVPHDQFMDPWRTFPPVPRHILGEVSAAEMRQHPFGTRTPVGNGPFRLASRAEGQSLTFEANEDFPAELGGRPYLDRLVYRVIPEPTTLLTELLTGTVDFYSVPPPEQASAIAADANLRLLR
jgi:peptide/nickel transport system substrate-binding protein